MTAAVRNTDLTMFNTLDRAGGRRMSPQAVTIAALLNGAILLLLIQQVRHVVSGPHIPPPIFLEAPILPPVPPSLKSMGGGGGHPDTEALAKGNPPAFSTVQLNPPKAPPLEPPKISIMPTIDVDPSIKIARTDLPNFGMPAAVAVGTSLGNHGKGGGLGSGDGPGIGPGFNGGMNGGLYTVGGRVSAPKVLFAPEPEFSEAARKAKVAGNVLVSLQVDTNGKPTHVRVLRGIGLGLDEKAVEAVSQYKFKPAMEDGKPVAVEMQVEVNFQIF
jgi:protein TonB